MRLPQYYRNISNAGIPNILLSLPLHSVYKERRKRSSKKNRLVGYQKSNSLECSHNNTRESMFTGRASAKTSKTLKIFRMFRKSRLLSRILEPTSKLRKNLKRKVSVRAYTKKGTARILATPSKIVCLS